MDEEYANYYISQIMEILLREYLPIMVFLGIAVREGAALKNRSTR